MPATALLPLALLMAIGFVLGRSLTGKSQEIGRLSLYVLSPAVLFKGFYHADLRSGALALLPFVVFVLCSAAALVARAVAGRLWHDGRERVAAFAAPTGNTGFFGIPACLAMVGPDSLPIAALLSFGTSAYENSVGFLLVARGEPGVGQALARMLRFPGLHACWMGAALNLAGLPLPAAVGDTVDLLAGGYSAVGMMIVGLGLAGIRRLDVDLGFTAFALAWKFLVWPAAALAFIQVDRGWLHAFPPLVHQVLLVESLVPMAAVTVVHATLQDAHPDRAALAVAVSTIVALFWLPLVFGWAGLH